MASAGSWVRASAGERMFLRQGPERTRQQKKQKWKEEEEEEEGLRARAGGTATCGQVGKGEEWRRRHIAR